jgi:hypothetical protein
LKSRILSCCLAAAVLAFGSAGAFAAVGHVNAAGKAHSAAKHKAKRHHARHHRRHHRAHAHGVSHAVAVQHAAATAPAPAPADGRSAAAQEYGTRPGKGCGDKNHQHTGPPGNPSNTDCPHH